MLVLFDLNGTLTDPAAIGDPWSQPDLGAEVLTGAVQSAMVDALLGSYRNFAEHIESALRAEIQRQSLDPGKLPLALELAAALPVFPEVPATVRQLAADGHTLAVLTNSAQESAEDTLEAVSLRGYFVRLIGTDRVRTFKPHPAVYRSAIEELGVKAQAVAFVTAHAWDLAGARHADMGTALVARRPVPPVFPTADITITDLAGLPEALKSRSW